MKRCWMVFLALILLAGCGAPSPALTPTQPGGFAPICGNGLCEGSEGAVSCPQDCPVEDVRVRSVVVYINSETVGNIAVLVSYPEQPRFPEGAGVVVVVSPFYSDPGGFMADPNLTSLGLIQVSYLWPGQSDAVSGAASEGTYDYGGETSLHALRDVIRFAAGRKPDINGRYIFSTIPVIPLTDEIGLYAYGGAGMAAVNVLARYPSDLQGLQYYVGRETPTIDTLACLEAGYRNEAGQPVPNPLYLYPSSFSAQAISIPYTNVRWAPDYVDSHTGAVGTAYLDLDGSVGISTGDYVFGWKAPQMFGKRYLSAALTRALSVSGGLSAANWPSDLATPEEAGDAWAYRNSSADRFISIQSAASLLTELKVMLVFAKSDTIQAAADKPHIHQSYQGFRFYSRLWVRLNPDRAYVQSLLPNAGTDFPDNPANTQPDDWKKIDEYAYPSQGVAARLVPLAAVAEMSDRTHYGRWDENLGQTLYIYFPPTEQP